MVDILKKKKPQSTVKAPFISLIEWALVVLMVFFFWRDILNLASGLLDWWFPRANISTPNEIITSVITLLTAFMAFFITVVSFLFAFTRKAGLPVFGFDDLQQRVALEEDDWEHEHNPSPAPQEPETPDFLLNPDLSEKTRAENPPPSERKIAMPLYYPFGHHYLAGRISQILSGTLLQLLWFFGFRGMNVFIRQGQPLSAEHGRQFSHVISSIASDFDSGFVLDSPQDEGDRQRVPPITGWYGLRFTFRRGFRGSAVLERITRTETAVTAYTSDGIEIEADVVANFILGQRPECVEVAYQKPALSERRPYTSNDLRVIRSKEAKEPYPGITIQSDPKDILDSQDAHFIHSMLRTLINEPGNHPYAPVPNQYTFEFNRGRIFRAISSKTITAKGETIEWESLPLHYAKDVFQKVLLNYTFDDLFGDVNTIVGDEYPVDEINAIIRQRVRNNSVLAFRLLWHRRSISLGDTDDANFPYRRNRIHSAPGSYLELPTEPLAEKLESDGKLLRARGIKVFNAAFENLRPRHIEIDQARADSWSASWDRNADFVRAESERDCIMIMNQAGVVTQHEMGENLLRIFESGNPDEVVMMQILSALQSLVNRKDIENFLPRDVNTILGNIEHWWKNEGKA